MTTYAVEKFGLLCMASDKSQVGKRTSRTEALDTTFTDPNFCFRLENILRLFATIKVGGSTRVVNFRAWSDSTPCAGASTCTCGIAAMLYVVGLGLCDAKDITVKGLEVVRKASRVYLEAYTSILTVGNREGGTGRICVNVLNYRAIPLHTTFSRFLPRI